MPHIVALGIVGKSQRISSSLVLEIETQINHSHTESDVFSTVVGYRQTEVNKLESGKNMWSIPVHFFVLLVGFELHFTLKCVGTVYTADNKMGREYV